MSGRATVAKPAGASIWVLGPELAAGKVIGANQYQTDLRINPSNAAAIVISEKLGVDEDKVAVLASPDYGATWSATVQEHASDPDVIFDDRGVGYWIFIDKAAEVTSVRTSHDSGQTWDAKQKLADQLDHAHLVVDRSRRSPYYGRVYITGREMHQGGVITYRSDDAGQRWARSMADLDGALRLGFVYAGLVSDQGALLVPMNGAQSILVGRDNAFAGANSQAVVLRSSDGGKTFSHVFVGMLTSPPHSGPGGFFGLSNLAAGRLGKKERVYLAFARGEGPGPQRLLLTTSDDGGLSWTPPSVIDGTSTGNAGAGSMSLAVAPDGTLGIQYFLIRRDGSFSLRFTASKDGGTTFAPSQSVSSGLSSESTKEQPRWIGQDQVLFDVDARGMFYTVWTDSRARGGSHLVTYVRTIQAEADAKRYGASD